MLFREATCKVCGKPITAAYRLVLCGNPECDDADRRDVWRRHDWRKQHGDEPYPYPRFRPLVKTCPICGQETRSPSPWANICEGYCKRIAQSNRMARFYSNHRDDILARQRAKREAARG